MTREELQTHIKQQAGQRLLAATLALTQNKHAHWLTRYEHYRNKNAQRFACPPNKNPTLESTP